MSRYTPEWMRPTKAEADRDAWEDLQEAAARKARFQAETAPVSIRCAHCKGRHGSVAEVAECADGEAQARAEAEADAEADRAYARAREAQAEAGTWFGVETEEERQAEAEAQAAEEERRRDSQWSWDYQNRWGRAENE